MARSAAQRRYVRTTILLMTGYGFILFGVTAFFVNGAPTGVSAYLAALLPALPVIGVFYAIGRYLSEETDEYIRMLEVRKALIATGFALSIATAWGFLENFGLVPHVYAYWAAILWFGGLGVGQCVNKFAAS